MAWGHNPLLGFWHRMLENPTTAEAALEPCIAALGYRYRCQHPFLALKHFADFALLDEKILIEVDGASHDTPAQREKDLIHMLAVLKLGWVVARVTNDFAIRDPEGAAMDALRQGRALRRREAQLESQYSEALGQLRQDYPNLLVDAAKRSMSRKQSALEGARKRAPATAARSAAKKAARELKYRNRASSAPA